MVSQLCRSEDSVGLLQNQITERFLELHPELLSRACAIAARSNDPEEVVQEILAFSYWNFSQAARKGRWLTAGQLAYIARRRVRGEGCTLGSSRTKTDVLSTGCRRLKRSNVLYLSGFAGSAYPDRLQDRFDEVVSQGQRNPADQAITRIDWGTLRSALSDRLKQVLDGLVAGRGTCEIAKHLRVSPARVTQLKDELGQVVAEFFVSTMPNVTFA
jgi:hypothetical protein